MASKISHSDSNQGSTPPLFLHAISYNLELRGSSLFEHSEGEKEKEKNSFPQEV